jgi:hypothetical protein
MVIAHPPGKAPIRPVMLIGSISKTNIQPFLDIKTIDMPKKKSRGAKKKPVVKKRSPAKKTAKVGIAPQIKEVKAIGTVAYHKGQARKQVEEQLAWLLLARDQEKNKRERIKLSKKVAQKRQELQKLK